MIGNNLTLINLIKEEICLEWFDFIRISWDNEMKLDFIEYCDYLIKEGFSDLENDVCNTLGLNRIPSINNNDIVDGVIFKSMSDKENKKSDKNYYKCNAVCMLNELKSIFSEETIKELKCDKSGFYIGNYTSTLRDILFDYIDLSELYNEVFNTGIQRKYLGNREQHTMTMHQVLRQQIYGQVSLHAFMDKEICMAVAVIRQLIEVRIRRAFGVLGTLNNNGGIEPINMSSIFEVLKSYINDIKFCIPLDKIIRIYSWANIYIHSGIKTYSWISIMLEKYLTPLSFGEKMKDGSRDINNGIVLKKEILDNLQKDIYDKYCNGKNLMTCKPEAVILKN